MTFDQLDAFKQELISDAYLDDLKQRMRLMVGFPIGALMTGGIWWVFGRGDSTGFGTGIVWIVGSLFSVLLAWMCFETFVNRRVKRVVQSFELEPEVERELLASVRSSKKLAAQQGQAMSAIVDEMQEGTRRGSRFGRGLRR